ncbi:MAG TPA: stress response translation initiation inhibitor YciH [Thermoplasmata archaeon]|nr:stress response translation initiation inhibitor YciH [Thermoplasmata archaeon]
MSEICPVCGLPKELCVCEEIAKEQQEIKIYLDKRRFGKSVTIIDGIDSRSINLSSLVTKLKAKCACGGTIKKGTIELQGDHRVKVGEALKEMGFQTRNK